ncbi:MAG: dihydroorotase [Alphaproteobacteria bacterium]
MDSITIIQPDDWHVHLRDGEMLKLVAHYTARQFGRAIIMPNLKPPVTDWQKAEAYRHEIMAALQGHGAGVESFTPLMTCYLTDDSDAGNIIEGHQNGVLTAAKLYPAHATTNSAHGVTDIKHIAPVLEAMQKAGMPLLIHGEVTRAEVDIFDREKYFIDEQLIPLRRQFPALKIVLEHITTAEAADYVAAEHATGFLAATITAHHLMINRNAMFQGGIRPHYYCLPIAKREKHRLRLREAAVSGLPCYFLGTDSAPHPIQAKETSCGCAGIFTAPTAIELYAGVFAEEGKLDRLEGFASLYGPAFYGLLPNERKITLIKQAQTVEAMVGSGSETILPFMANETLPWVVST